MADRSVAVELLVNPFCMAERDVDAMRKLCAEHDVPLTIYNLWDLDERAADELPAPIAKLLREWRTGQRPGSVYSSLFVDGERIPLNDWPKHMEAAEESLAAAAGGRRK